MKKPEGLPAGGPSPLPADLCIMLKCPSLVEHLSAEQWDDGTPRERSTLTVFIEEGQFKLCLNDRNQGSSLFVASQSLREAVKALEKRLDGSQAADWRPWKRKGRK